MKLPRSLKITLPALLAVPVLSFAADERLPIPSDDGVVMNMPVSSVAKALPVEVKPGDPNLFYSGRFEKTADGATICAWPASAVTLRFRGTDAVANLGVGANRVQVIVDGKPAKILTGNAKDINAPAPAPQLYTLASGLPDGEHTVTLFKCTEANCGNVTFAGFQISARGTALPASAPKRRILVIGDSISAGYGNEAASQQERFSPATENAYWTYGAMTARALGADYTCLAWSGRTLYPTFTLPEIFDRTLPRDAASVWSGDARQPDVILVNLCTNDFNRKETPEEEPWVTAYHAFLQRLRKDAPQAAIYLAHGPMISDSYPKGVQAATKSRQYIQRVVKESNDKGDAKVYFLEFPTQKVFEDGVGADWHPNVKTHRDMSARFLAAIKENLGWDSASAK